MLMNDHWLTYVRPLKPVPIGIDQRGEPIGKVACIVFDIYGTLLISGSGDIGIVKKADKNLDRLEELFQRYRIPHSPNQLLDAFFSAIKTEHSNLKRKGIDYPEVNVIRIWETVLDCRRPENLHNFALEFELIINPVYPMPHLSELLAACRRTDTQMGIVSNAQFYTPILIEYFLNSELVDLGFDPDLTVFSYQLGRAKPSSVLFEKVGTSLDKKHMPRSSSLYIGNDMLNDIKPAKRSGFQTALFAGDARSLRLRTDDIRCQGLSADMVVTDLLQLVDFLER
jgi:putative hydrolase of the HAD superfamily